MAPGEPHQGDAGQQLGPGRFHRAEMQAVVPAGQMLQRRAGALPCQIGRLVLQGPRIFGGIDVDTGLFEQEGVARMIHMGMG